MCCIMAKARKHFDFVEKKEYLRNKTYPSTIPARDYGSKSNFWFIKGYQRQRTLKGNYQRRTPRYLSS